MEIDLSFKFDNNIRCALCNNISAFEQDYPGNTIRGYPDLDTRPSETGRSPKYKVQRCPYCGYCAENISRKQNSTTQIIDSHKYILQLNNKYFPELCNSFLCKSLVDYSNNNYIECCWSYIYAAWVCDDLKNDFGSIYCRKQAINIIKELEKENKLLTENQDDHIKIKIDLMRRATFFEEVSILIQKYLTEIQNEEMLKILIFQEELIKKFDIGCYTLEDVKKKEDIKEKYMPNYNKIVKQKIYKHKQKVVNMNIIFNDLVANLFKELNKLSAIPADQKDLTLNDYKELVTNIEKIVKMIRITLDIDNTKFVKGPPLDLQFNNQNSNDLEF